MTRHPTNRAERLALKQKKNEKKIKPSSQVRRIKEFIQLSEAEHALLSQRYKDSETKDEFLRSRTEDVGSLVRQL